ncbi:constitutive coactivator of peroxisome proliferator-activated receptor gamma [Parambassis ranga]|uniref:Constitutive coactivator of peroxisome proliferator-activated receptor gamma n=1 Tax=Parambassis ranga TaxID=210632 RepID=A0A6P7HXZ7_9TELE|nr:constitutive coactivator of peroxisome proliferator-activated receptor gamma [Parambassis ranga]XP_028258503.1 constitutive coactivator of peroxisome proliferator-activated receptor gamma [Parambassis ranga]XP_028258504.1 constitutive coactivator of peroxisome proliferator-activated receptor gamma [Parambassis ranga]
MGVKGLQYFIDHCCPEACETVNLSEMAKQHVVKSQRGCGATDISPTLVVDGMACLCHWYSCKDWACGGQWKEYMDVLKSWVGAFTSAGIRLVFFFDGVVEEQKRREWVKRRRRVNGNISKIFCHIKEYGVQPGGELFCLPSGLATFTPFALRSLGQEVFCSVREADYEIASYALQHGSMGILGQDSDFIIYDSAPYLSVAKLQINNLSTVMYDRQRLCRAIGLTVTQLPLLACLLGNDVVSEEQMQHIRNYAMAMYRKNNPTSHPGASQRQVVLAVSKFVSSLYSINEEKIALVPQSLNLTTPQRGLLERGICFYVLPGQKAFKLGDTSLSCAFEKYVSPEILKACREKHVAAEGFMVHSVVCEGVTECSNTLEDEVDTELPPQAAVYKPCRQRIYGLLLLLGHNGSTVDLPAIREWFVFPGNPLKEPDMVHPVPIILPCTVPMQNKEQSDQPSLDLLWCSTGPEVSVLRLKAFLSVFDCVEFSELYGAIEDSLLAALCLVTYIVLQVHTVSQEDVDAYLSQAVCLRKKSAQELQQIELPFLSSRAVQLGSLYIRGLSHLLGANCASGGPLPNAALMPWHSFDGRLFHSKYLLAHSGTEKTELLESDLSSLSQFLQLREKLIETCKKRDRVLLSRPKPPQRLKTPAADRDRNTGWHSGGGENWRERGETAGGHLRGQGWKERGQERRGRSRYEQGGHRRGGQHFPSFHPPYHDEGPWNTSQPTRQPRGRLHHNRGRYQLAPRWQHPHAPGP